MSDQFEASLALVVAADYDLGSPIACRFLFHGFNDHYRVTAGGLDYHLRLYLDRKYWIRGDDDLEFELEMLDDLARTGHRVLWDLGDMLTAWPGAHTEEDIRSSLPLLPARLELTM